MSTLHGSPPTHVRPAPPGGAAVLERRHLGAPTLFVLAVSAASPLTVLGGGIPATLAATGVIAVAVSFPLLAVMLAALAVGYTAAAKAMAHAPSGRRSPAIS